MPKLDIEKIKHECMAVFKTKKAMLNYIKKASFSKWGFSHYEMNIAYYNKKWFVRWE